MIIQNHLLIEADHQLLPGGVNMPVRRCLVIHFTAGATAQSSVNFWRSPEAKGANAHIVIDRDGSIIQCRAFNRTAGHAGISKWTDPNTDKVYVGLNACSIGIELANAGDGANEDGTAFSSRKFKCPAGVKLARHKNDGKETWWEVYPQDQLTVCFALCKALVQAYNLDDIVGHDDIAPGRKRDPGPLLDLSALRRHCGF